MRDAQPFFGKYIFFFFKVLDFNVRYLRKQRVRELRKEAWRLERYATRNSDWDVCQLIQVRTGTSSSHWDIRYHIRSYQPLEHLPADSGEVLKQETSRVRT
jgi:hypothetical protein